MSYRVTTWKTWPSKSRALLSVGLMLLLPAFSACSSKPPQTPPPLIETPQPPKPVLPKPSPLSLESVAWEVWEFEDKAYFALPPDQYEALSRNTAELLRWVSEANYQLNFYRSTRQPTTDQKGDASE